VLSVVADDGHTGRRGTRADRAERTMRNAPAPGSFNAGDGEPFARMGLSEPDNGDDVQAALAPVHPVHDGQRFDRSRAGILAFHVACVQRRPGPRVAVDEALGRELHQLVAATVHAKAGQLRACTSLPTSDHGLGPYCVALSVGPAPGCSEAISPRAVATPIAARMKPSTTLPSAACCCASPFMLRATRSAARR
jgi:hypothetical protein